MARQTHLRGAAQAFAVTYLLLQSAGVLLFWTLLAGLPALRSHFVMRGSPDATFLCLVLADGVFLAGTGIAAALGLIRPRRWTGPMLWLHTGAAIYAALCALGMWIADRNLWLGAGLMAPVLVTPLLIATKATATSDPGAALDQPPSPLGPIVRSVAQVLVFWTFFLFVAPRAIALASAAVGIEPIEWWPRGRVFVAGVLFAIGGAIGLWACWVLCVIGRGTPLPIDPTFRLVIAGPYRAVRNPMAVGGLLQGVAVALWWGSWPIAVYVLVGAVLWHIAIRPAEEAELAERFGADYQTYRARVRCWIPRGLGSWFGSAAR